MGQVPRLDGIREDRDPFSWSKRFRIDEENLAAFAVTYRRSSEHLGGESFLAFNYL